MHTMGAFAFIFDEDSRVLLCHRTDRDAWNLPGGRVEFGESPWDAVVREVQEEIGVAVRVERLIGIYSVPTKNDLVFSFVCGIVCGDLKVTAEADVIQWFPRDGIPANTLPRQIERIADAYTDSTLLHLKTQP